MNPQTINTLSDVRPWLSIPNSSNALDGTARGFKGLDSHTDSYRPFFIRAGYSSCIVVSLVRYFSVLAYFILDVSVCRMPEILFPTVAIVPYYHAR